MGFIVCPKNKNKIGSQIWLTQIFCFWQLHFSIMLRKMFFQPAIPIKRMSTKKYIKMSRYHSESCHKAARTCRKDYLMTRVQNSIYAEDRRIFQNEIEC
jgi:hypothetical protein